MNPFLDTPQIEELIEFNYWDDEETKIEVEDYYDDLASGIPFDSSYDFWWLNFLPLLWLWDSVKSLPI